MGTPYLHIRLLGPIEVTLRAGAPYPGTAEDRGQAESDAVVPAPSSPTARSLLAYLILHHDRRIPRDRLLGLFWPERADIRARRALSHALWQIRQALGPAADRLVTEGDAVAFAMQADDWLDVETFEEQVCKYTSRQVSNALPSHSLVSLSTCLLELSEAVAIYRSDFLVDIYDDWALVERERLRELYLRALEQLIALHKQRGDDERALNYAQRLAATDPLREAAHRELMRIYHLLGRTRAALQQFHVIRDLLADELSVEPSAATAALYVEVASSLDEAEPAHLPLPAPPPPLLRDLAHLPFVGRADERSTLISALQDALQGHGGVALVEGDAGVGKSRLVEEITSGARWRGFQAGPGKADPLTASPPYQLLRDALSPLLTPLRVAQLAELIQPLWLSTVAPLLPPVADQIPDLTKLPSLDPQQERRRLWEGLSRVLTGLASVAPLLLVLEDVHWADEATLTAIPHLASHFPTSRALLILTYRLPEARQRAVAWETLNRLDQTLPLLRIHLSSFEHSEAMALVRRALGAAEMDAQATAFADRLEDEIGGNALFLVETLKSLLEQRELTLGSDVSSEDGSRSTGWRFPAEDLPLPIPSSVPALINERVTRLPAEIRDVLERIAMLGEDAEFRVLTHAGDMNASALLAALEELGQRGFLLETPERYCFVHDLVQDTVYQAIPQSKRSALHHRVGCALEAIHPERVESLAFHFHQAGIRRKALTYILQASERAMAVHDYERALAHHRKALALVQDDAASRWNVLAQQESALHTLSRRDAQAEVLSEMLRLAKALDDPLLLARTYHCQGWREVLAGETTHALSLLEEAIELAREVGEHDLLGDCLISAARAWWRMGNLERCQAAIEEAQALFQETSDRQAEIRALNMLGNLHLGLTGDYAQALAQFERNQHIALELSDTYKEAAARGNIGITCTLLGRYRRSQEALAEAAQVMTEVGDRHWQGIILHWQGANHRALGNLTQARAAAEKSLAICREVNNANFEIAALELLGLIALDEHDADEASVRFQQAAGVAEVNQQTMDGALQRSHLALAYFHLGHPAKARRLSEQAIATLEGLGGRLSHMKDVYFERHQIIAATEGPEAARSYLELAHQHLMDMAADIADPELRRSFLENVRENQAIVTAHRLGRLPPSLDKRQVRLPADSAPTGRSLRDDEHVEVTWTVAAPQDDDIVERVARRRHRILRLLRQAAEQSAAPNIGHLADALDVSARTIRRDLAALRAQGHEVRTRGSRT